MADDEFDLDKLRRNWGDEKVWEKAPHPTVEGYGVGADLVNKTRALLEDVVTSCRLEHAAHDALTTPLLAAIVRAVEQRIEQFEAPDPDESEPLADASDNGVPDVSDAGADADADEDEDEDEDEDDDDDDDDDDDPPDEDDLEFEEDIAVDPKVLFNESMNGLEAYLEFHVLRPLAKG